jgi:hypothetical protein
MKWEGLVAHKDKMKKPSELQSERYNGVDFTGLAQ